MILLLSMSQPNLSLTPVDAVAPAPEPDAAWNEVVRLLHRAAKLAGPSDSGDAFMQAAWAAFLDERPGLREALEDKELRSQLKKLRKKGLVGQA